MLQERWNTSGFQLLSELAGSQIAAWKAGVLNWAEGFHLLLVASSAETLAIALKSLAQAFQELSSEKLRSSLSFSEKSCLSYFPVLKHPSLHFTTSSWGRKRATYCVYLCCNILSVQIGLINFLTHTSVQKESQQETKLLWLPCPAPRWSVCILCSKLPSIPFRLGF